MSAIAKTASITLITAVPGSGKTLRTVWYADKAVKAGELVFACNVSGLNIPQVAEFPDPTRWQELPAGSILIVDEAQQFFRAAKPSDPLPDYIAAMETIRHNGIRLILITQHPALIHSNIRALTGLHEHLVRENGKQAATVYRRNAIMDNVRSHTALQREDRETWAYPKHVFDLYKSAEVHTVKRTFHARNKKALAMFAVAALIIGAVFYRMQDRLLSDQSENVEATAADKAQAARADQPADAAPLRKGERPMVTTAEEYAKLYTPLIPNAPWSAPAFTNRDAVAEPTLACMSTERSCRCLTEQGTRYVVPEKECRDMARNGPMYNPFRSPSQSSVQGSVAGMGYTVKGGGGAGGAPPAAMGANASASSPGVVIDSEQVTGHGGFRGEQANSAP